MNYIASAFSLAMFPTLTALLAISPVDPADIPLDAISTVGHVATAQALSLALSRPIPANRVALQLSSGDTIYVSQFRWPGGRAPENTRITTPEDLPPITWMKVEVL
jgi:hypothetical protein